MCLNQLLLFMKFARNITFAHNCIIRKMYNVSLKIDQVLGYNGWVTCFAFDNVSPNYCLLILKSAPPILDTHIVVAQLV